MIPSRSPAFRSASTLLTNVGATYGFTSSTAAVAFSYLTPAEARFVEAPGFAEAHDIVLGNCAMCHAREPVWPGIRWAPKGVLLETEADVARHAKVIALQAGYARAMPPPNAFEMPQEDRAALVAWVKSAD